MSDVTQGSGWRQASDEKWCPPESHSSFVPPPSTFQALDGNYYNGPLVIDVIID